MVKTLRQRIKACLLLTVYLSVLFTSFSHVHVANTESGSSNLISENGIHNSETENIDSHTCFLCDFLGTTYVQTSSLLALPPQEFLVTEKLLVAYTAIANEKSSPCTIRGPCFL